MIQPTKTPLRLPWKLTCPLKINGWKMYSLLNKCRFPWFNPAKVIPFQMWVLNVLRVSLASWELWAKWRPREPWRWPRARSFPWQVWQTANGWGGQRTQPHTRHVMGMGGRFRQRENAPSSTSQALQVSVPTPIMLAVSVPTPSKRTPVALLLQLCHRHGEDDLISYVCRSVSKMSEH